jgi:hypothetical protein
MAGPRVIAARVNQQFTGHCLFSDSRMFFERSGFSMIVCAVRTAGHHLAMIALALVVFGANQARAGSGAGSGAGGLMIPHRRK